MVNSVKKTEKKKTVRNQGADAVPGAPRAICEQEPARQICIGGAGDSYKALINSVLHAYFGDKKDKEITGVREALDGNGMDAA